MITDTDNPTNMLRFHRPPAACHSGDDRIFPPTVFTDAKYSRGILVPNAAAAAAAAAAATDHRTVKDADIGLDHVAIPIPDDYYFDGRGGSPQQGRIPSLSQDEAARWNDSYAAHAAARRRSPMETVRLLGTITLLFEEQGGSKPSSKGSLFDQSRKFSNKYSKRHVETCDTGFCRQPAAVHNKFAKTLSRKQALAEACTDMGLVEVAEDSSSLSRDVQRQLERRAKQISEYWKNVRESPPLQECWNQKDGGFVREAVEASNRSVNNDEECFIPIACLLGWMENDGITDLSAGRMKSLYNGLRQIPTDAMSILKSLMDLSCPSTLYKIPLITPYAVARRIVQNVRSGEEEEEGILWKVRIGVYMNRLLPEVLTANTLHCVMSALDDGSFVVTEPLHMPPMRNRNDPVFESSKYPIVRLPGVHDDDDDTSMGEEKKEDDDDMPTDPTVMGSTREQKTISPFTPKGLLKLMENTGNDISMFPTLARSLSRYLKLDLMLHQRHALCWMSQMEHLPGFGINSIIWEERAFLDGGKYYYSPALGQIRLDRPPATVGGCVADEMGLGKTLQMLCLIASSLDKLKLEALNGGENCTHTTLIIVPPALVMQWVSEIKKSCGETLKVNVLDANNKRIDQDLIQSGGSGSDILITTYSALEKPKTIQSWRWGRIVLDEQQEIRSSTTAIAKNCESLNCHRRWMLSGTPIFEGIEDLRGELNFLRLVPYAAKWEDGFFDFSVMNHWNMHSQHGLETLRILGLLILRRSKDMTICATGQSIMDQRKLTVDLVPIAQSDSERALYCWFEFLVSQELQRKDENSNTKKNLQSRALCLRLLREICFSPVMVNGGLGAASQMKVLNTLYRKILARIEQRHNQNDRRKKKKSENIRVMSPPEALRYLSQAEREANVGDDFVSDQQFSRGQGAASRVRAVEGIDDQVNCAQDTIDEASKKEADARRKRAKAYWHLALELISTGALRGDNEETVSPKISFLWNWRRLCIERENADGNKSSVAPCLLRGWRPCSTFAEDILTRNSSFHWARPGCLRLENIPAQVSLNDITSSIFDASKKEPRARSKLDTLRKSLEKAKELDKPRLQSDIKDAEEILFKAVAYDQLLQRPTVINIGNSTSTENWMAYVRASDEEQLIRNAQSKAGIVLKSEVVIPRIQAALDNAKELFEQTDAENSVHPCAKNTKKKRDAQKALDKAKLGLTINFGSTSTANVVMSRAAGSLRGTAPQSRSALVEGSYAAIAQAVDSLERALARLEHGRSTLSRLMTARSRGVQDTAQKSAYDTLEALRRNDFGGTFCPICLANFGENAGDDPKLKAMIVAMISCGHFYCIKCLDQQVHADISKNKTHTCPTCRMGFSPSSDIINIDHLANEDEDRSKLQTEAKTRVREASAMLATSDGVLGGDLWESLFLSIDVPTHVSSAPHHLHTALPRDLLAHFRAATGMKVDCAKSDKPNSAGLSTKIQALLCDLPFGEHSVVFSCSKEGVLHLATVIKAQGIDCFSLYTGQHTKATEKAVSSWNIAEVDVSKAGPVLVVQAGAAASGLTLTTASKLFLMEPFSRQEEEQQAYARCHRYGQKKDVYVKIYYAPVTVESRLLRWRKRIGEKLTENDETPAAGNITNYVSSQLFEEEGEDYSDDRSEMSREVGNEEEGEGDNENNIDGEKDSAEAGDNLRTQFLLGLVDEEGNPIASNDAGHQDAADTLVSARRFVLD